MKTPKFLSKLSAVLTPRPKKRLQATARAARRPVEEYDEEEPTTKLSSAFIVVLILHVVAVGGIYAFNSIKASRKERAVASAMDASALPKSPPADAATAGASASHPAAASPAEPAPIPPLTNKPAGRTYTVKANDNLTKIAFAYSVTPTDLLQANHLKDPAVLHAGQVLVIPDPKTATAKTTADTRKTDATPKQSDVAPTATTPGFYTVKKGDTPTSIAHNFGLTAEELLKANRITDPKKLQPGQTLKVPPRKS
jgi:LysM repeat protein